MTHREASKTGSWVGRDKEATWHPGRGKQEKPVVSRRWLGSLGSCLGAGTGRHRHRQTPQVHSSAPPWAVRCTTLPKYPTRLERASITWMPTLHTRKLRLGVEERDFGILSSAPQLLGWPAEGMQTC